MKNVCQTQKKLANLVPSLEKSRVLIIGDVMLDAYLTGSAERISPEAPVPVVRITDEHHLLGGAGNVAKNITSLLGNAWLVGVRGEDYAGETLENILSNNAIKANLVALPNRPTTVKTRVLAQRQQMLRFDHEHIVPHSTKESTALLGLIQSLLGNIDTIILSDYGKGLVTQFFMDGLFNCILHSGRKIPVLVDPKPVNTLLYKRTTLLTPNKKETSELAHMPVSTEKEIKKAGLLLMEQLELQHLTATLGAEGMAVFTGNKVWYLPTTAQKVFDVTGAGDTVIATMAMALSAGHSLVDACMLANYAAGVVVGEVGAAVASPKELTSAILHLPFSLPEEW